MSSTGLIVGLVAIGGGLLLLSRRKAAAPAPAPGGDACDLIPDPDARAACKDASTVINLGGTLLNAISDANNTANDALAREKAWDADNTRLNGATAITTGEVLGYDVGDTPYDYVNPFSGKTLKFANGCTPFKGSPGFGACAAGTHDMRRSVVQPEFTSSQEGSRPAQATLAQRNAIRAADTDDFGFKRVDWSKLLTGSAVSSAQDPATVGPGPSGTEWRVKGVKVTCPAGQAPALWDANGNPLPSVNGIPPCAPGGRTTTVQTSYGTQNTSHTSSSSGCTPPAGFTWDASIGGWRRRTAAENASGAPVQLPPECTQPVSSSPIAQLGSSSSSLLAQAISSSGTGGH